MNAGQLIGPIAKTVWLHNRVNPYRRNVTTLNMFKALGIKSFEFYGHLLPKECES